MSINSKLTTFAQQELVMGYNDVERERINNSLTQLEKALKGNLNGHVKEITRFGSLTRNTILPRKHDPLSDVDILLVFKTDNTKRIPGTYRKYIVDALSTTYPVSVVKKDFPTVKLELNHIIFDVVPAYTEEYWGKSYYIPSANDGWTSTSPNDINSNLSSMNQSYGNNIVRNVIRLCKHWNAGANYPLQSYLMEKQIVNSFFCYGDDLYAKFLSVLNNIAGDRPGVRQALEYIQAYKGSWSQAANEAKQFEWLQKLLPGLK